MAIAERGAARPDFLFIGPDKSGSSWLYEVLRQHPACFVPPAKDIYFFDRHYHRGWSWYGRHFEAAAPGCLASGELSHDYLFSPAAASRIARDLPAVKLLTILREPVERSFSHYLYMIRSGRTRLGFTEALQEFPELVENSLYARHLRTWFGLFPRPQLGVFFFDELQAAPRALGGSILAFLGLPACAEIDYERRVLAAAAPRSAAAARLARGLATATRELGFANLVGGIKRSRAAQLMYRPYAAGERPRLAETARRALQERFAPDLVELRALLGAGGPQWLAAPTAPAPERLP